MSKAKKSIKCQQKNKGINKISTEQYHNTVNILR